MLRGKAGETLAVSEEEGSECGPCWNPWWGQQSSVVDARGQVAPATLDTICRWQVCPRGCFPSVRKLGVDEKMGKEENLKD